MLIRSAEERDLDAVRHLFGLLSGSPMTPEQMHERFEMIRRSPIDELFVCEKDGSILGAMGFRVRECVEHVGSYGEISALITDPDIRRAGIGRKLVAFAESHARELGCDGTWLVSGLHRKDEAHIFYQSLGFVKTGCRFVKPF